ncbi:MAG: hypothetical protein HW384_2032 [Dehalococcoidia bacterium]|nr:hypothetical protein [Dehalococcoidia bacterium]
MTKFPVVSGENVIKALNKLGFRFVSQEGSHVKLRLSKIDRVYTVIVPVHPELARKTLRSILKQADLTLDEFRRLL